MNKRNIIIISAVILVIISAFIFIKKGSVKYITKPLSKDTITQYVEASLTWVTSPSKILS